MFSVAQKALLLAYVGGKAVKRVYVGQDLLWSSWEYPVQDGNKLTITQAYEANSNGSFLRIDSSWPSVE